MASTSRPPAVSNIFVPGGIALIATAVGGRRLGPLMGVASYPLRFWLDGETSVPSPHSTSCLDTAERLGPKWLPASALVLVGLSIWYRSGGASTRSRQIDGVG